MSFLKSIKKQMYIISVNAKIKKAKYVHLMFNDKFNKPFVDFLNRNFNSKEHLVLCKIFYEFPFPEGDNVIELKYLARLKFNKVQKLICHSLFDNEVVDYLYKHPDILRNKAYWIMWGGDLYDAVRDEKNDFVRNNFKGYLNKIDEKYARKKYEITENQKFYDIFYTFPITKPMLNSITPVSKDYIQIQINNSCDKTTLEMLDVLAKYKEKNIKITTVLSYGELEYKDEIIKKGNEIFGNKFNYMDKFLAPEKYLEQIAQNDILIFNQDRQQGFGNIISALNLGCKVYIKKDVSVNEYFNKNGINNL